MAKAAWEKDAEQFGRRFRFGEWESALLVARSVDKGYNPKSFGSTRPASRKGSTAEFAQVADVGTSTVKVYMRAWEFAAKDGLVPSSDKLLPGSELDDLPEAEDWAHYYRMARPPSAAKETEAPDVPANSLQNAWHHAQDVVRYIQEGRLTPLDREEIVPLARRVKAAAEYIIEAAASEDAPVVDWDKALAELDGGA